MDFKVMGSTVLAYLIGSFPTGVALSKWRYGIDVREMGSGNIGATNVTRSFGWYAGAIVFLIDFAKGFFPLYVITQVFPEHAEWIPAVGIALVVGHCFSIFLKFRGGKGVATTLGCLAAVDMRAALIGSVIYLVLLAVTRISAVGSLFGLGLATCYVMIREAPIPTQRLAVAVLGIVLIRHRSNIARLIQDFRNIRKSSSRNFDSGNS